MTTLWTRFLEIFLLCFIIELHKLFGKSTVWITVYWGGFYLSVFREFWPSGLDCLNVWFWFRSAKTLANDIPISSLPHFLWAIWTYECCRETNLCHILYNPPPPVLITQNKYSFHAEIYIVFGTVRCRKSLTRWKINHPRREVSKRPKNVLPETFSSFCQTLFKTDNVLYIIYLFLYYSFFSGPKVRSWTELFTQNNNKWLLCESIWLN